MMFRFVILNCMVPPKTYCVSNQEPCYLPLVTTPGMISLMAIRVEVCKNKVHQNFNNLDNFLQHF